MYNYNDAEVETDSDMAESASKRLRKLSVMPVAVHDVKPLPERNRKFCPHCNRDVSTKTFKFHKRLYYDKVIRWTSETCSYSIAFFTSGMHYPIMHYC